MSEVLSLQQAGVQFESHQALREVNLSVHLGERVALVGANGCGKSTLLRVAHGLLPVTQGQVLRTPGVRQAMVFQRPHMLRMSAVRGVALGIWMQGVPWRAALDQAMQAITPVGLQDLAHRSARHLSGGQQQRLALARAWALKPQCLLLDEPTSSLDPHAKREVERLLHDWVQTTQLTLLFSSHNLGQVKRLAPRVIYLEAGRVLADLPVADFFGQPLAHSHPEAHLFLKGELV
jgi:tungstate transport system ATP-binding protein